MEKEEPKIQSQEEEQAQSVPCADPASPEELAAMLEESEREREQFTRLLQRTQADFANYRKRAEEERLEHEQQANARLLQKLLPVMDEFELAIDHADQSSTDQSWLEGIRLIHRKLSTFLESESVVRIEASEKEFDPFEHEAVAHQESDEVPEGTVIEVLQDGYKLHGRILRPAKVVVAKGVSSSQETEEKEDA